jgi:hypothetical protein
LELYPWRQNRSFFGPQAPGELPGFRVFFDDFRKLELSCEQNLNKIWAFGSERLIKLATKRAKSADFGLAFAFLLIQHRPPPLGVSERVMWSW